MKCCNNEFANKNKIIKININLKKDLIAIFYMCCYTAFKKMGLAILNLGLAILNGFLWYKNNEVGNYKQSSFSAFACGFCFCVAIVLFFK